MEIKVELKKIIQELKELRTEETIKISDESLFDAGMRLFISRSINSQGKKGHQPPSINNSSSLASQSQKNLLKKLKIEFNESITSKEASKLIESKIGKKK